MHCLLHLRCQKRFLQELHGGKLKLLVPGSTTLVAFGKMG